MVFSLSLKFLSNLTYLHDRGKIFQSHSKEKWKIQIKINIQKTTNQVIPHKMIMENGFVKWEKDCSWNFPTKYRYNCKEMDLSLWSAYMDSGALL